MSTPGPLFSKRLEITKAAEAWCRERSIPVSPFNIVTALAAQGYITGEGRLPLKGEMDVGSLAPSPRRYLVTSPADHMTLEAGDEVAVVEDRSLRNWLLRMSDLTLHDLQDKQEVSVRVVELNP